MFVKQNETDKAKVLDYISADPEMNLFIYGDIASYGVNKGPVSTYLNILGDGSIDSLLLKYSHNYVFYSKKPNFDSRSVRDLICKDTRASCISGKMEPLRALGKEFPTRELVKTYMCSHHLEVINTPSLPSGFYFRSLSTLNDYTMEAKLLYSIEEFARTYRGQSEEESIAKAVNGFLAGHHYNIGIFNNSDDLVAVSNLTALSEESGMVVGLATKKGYRGLGLATAMINKQCLEAKKAKRKFICLFYDNPEAGKIYRKAGFKEIGEYGMLNK